MTAYRFLLATLLLAAACTANAQSRVSLSIDAGGGQAHTIVIELDETNTPKTASNFKKLAEEGFYEDIAFHRVVPNYIVQVGDPLTKDPSQKSLWGTGGTGYTVPAETGQKHVRGSVAMARLSDGVNPSRASSGSQFYICLTDIPSLDGDYTVFGKVVSGLEHIDRVSQAASDANNNPVSRIAIAGSKVDHDASVASVTPTEAAEAKKASDTASAMLAPRVESPSAPMTATTPTTTLAAAESPPATPPLFAAAASTTGDSPPPSTGAAMTVARKDAETSIPDSAAGIASAAKAALASGESPKEMAATVLAAAESAIAGKDGESEFAALVAAAKEKAGIPTELGSTTGAATATSGATGAMPTSIPTSSVPVVAEPTPELPTSDGGVAGAVNADLTQPVARTRTTAGGRSQVVIPVKASDKPKKKEGIFTRMIKKVW